MTTLNLFPQEASRSISPYEHPAGERAIETLEFPFEEISRIAEHESWRKEVNRPIYHIHKWWAQRLGSVFRALIIGAFSDASAEVLDLFYKPTRVGDVTVFDPFMGSGTTLGEVLKLGGKAIGRDINPVAYCLVKNALNLPSRSTIYETYRAIQSDTAPKLLDLYSVQLAGGKTAQVLYFFWVKMVPCVHCRSEVDLFSSYVFAQNAYPERQPVQILCPRCGDVHSGMYGDSQANCPTCGNSFNPNLGPAAKVDINCPACGGRFRIVDAIADLGRAPAHRMYAKLVLTSDGEKIYVPADEMDLKRYQHAERLLAERREPFPNVAIEYGYNTKQVLNYGYRSWHEMFNSRQLLCISILGERIRAIPEKRVRELFCCFFSGVLEFNNMFASYKGEGTGAVRHMFAHHVLKPERVPIEANFWGTEKSSGAFSSLFKSRLLRALDYAENPFELKLSHGGPSTKVFDLSVPLDAGHTHSLQLSCGNSAVTDLPSESVDAVITDPPFFDNVHYSELADFFHVWQRHIIGQEGNYVRFTTRSTNEVQHTDSVEFQARLEKVFAECQRVLTRDGLLIFTFHHSRQEGWQSVLAALGGAGFVVTRVHPIRSEMTVAMPKRQAKSPITFDIVFVCRKRQAEPPMLGDPVQQATSTAREQLCRLVLAGLAPTENDVRVIVTSNVVQVLSALEPSRGITLLRDSEAQIEKSALLLVEDMRAKRLNRKARI